jgi:DNA primase
MAIDFAQTVKQQADIVRVIGEYVRLKKSGAQNFNGLCPFHGEKTPSFSVHSGRQFYHCFGCGQSGDVFSFVQKIENVSFPESVRVVAQKSGIPLPKREFSSPEEAQESRQRARLLELHEQATTWFEEQLRSPEGASAREYLTGRGATPEAIAKFRIGYAPDNFNALRDRLQSAADPEILRLSGLFSSKEQEDGRAGPLYSRFRKRVMFPIANESGRVIAFTARALDSGDKAGPKYLNSPETSLYSKGQVLFNLDKARQAIKRDNIAILVEGQMDCISVFMAGIQNVLATSGTAFTEAQVRILRRFTERVVVNFDPDTAGANAAEKSIAMLTEEGFEVRVVTLEGGLDPDRFVRERGVQAYVDALRGAQRLPDYLIERARQLFPPRSAEAKIKALNYLLPHIRRLPHAVAREDFVLHAAERLQIDSALMRQELKLAAAKKREQVSPVSLTISECERVLLRALSTPPGSAAFECVAKALTEQPVYFEALTESSLLVHLSRRGSQEPLQAAPDERARGLLAELLMNEAQPVTPEEVSAAIESARRSYLERRQRALRAAIADAERRGDWGQVATLTAEKLALDKQLRDA